ncbi:MAG: shufflon system plasmid conjugative transfer pilus tip adhesin PilV, partial [Caldilinea sp.]|nr:shufflon system plasmid conjugative transfer pilus tip adhesin PilV [Caldilinea sp.]
SYADGTGGSEGTQTWTWTRNAGTPGAATGTIAADSLALDFGVSGNGYYEVNAIDGPYAENSPYWRIVTWAGHPATQTVRVQGGNLKGLFGQANEYGFYAGDGVTTASKYLRLSTATNEFRNLTASWYKAGTMVAQVTPNNGLRLQVGSGYPYPDEYAVSWYSNLGAGTGKTWSIGTYSDDEDWMTIESAVSDSRRKVLRMEAASTTGMAMIDLIANPSPQGNGKIILYCNDNIHLMTNSDVTVGSNEYKVLHQGNGGHGTGFDADRLDGWHSSNFVYVSSYTAADVLAKVLTVDGHNSGLDADTIDTVQVERIIFGENARGSTGKTDINWNGKSGFYSKTGSDVGGAPWGSYFHVIEATYAYDSYYGMQIAQYFWGEQLYHRIFTNSSGNKSFGSWVRIADDVSLGNGSHVDAYFTGHIRAGSTGLSEAGSVSANNWFRSVGSNGWFNATHSGGIYMTDSTWIRTYNNKGFYCNATMQATYLRVEQNASALGDWAAVTLGTGWANYGSGYVSARYRRFGDVVHVHGMVKCTNASYGGILNLPYQIAARYIYEPASSVQHVRVDAVPGSGYTSIQIVGTPVLNMWVMLDMIIPIY